MPKEGVRDQAALKRSRVPSRLNTSSFALTVQYVTALLIVAALAVASYFHLWSVIEQGGDNAGLVNLSGRQRMLSQRICFYSLKLVNAATPQERDSARSQLKETIQFMQKSHETLTRGDKKLSISPNQSDAVREMYFQPPFQIDSQVINFLREASALADDPPLRLTLRNKHFRYVLEEGPKHLLQSLNAVVNQIQADRDKSRVALQAKQGVFLFINLLILGFIGIFIFRPMVRRIVLEQEELLSSRRRLASVLDAVDEAIFAIGLDGKIRTANRAAGEIWGYDLNELIHLPWYHLFADEKAVLDKIISLKSRGEGNRWELRGKSQDGKIFALEIRINQIFQGDELIYTVAAQDITERKRAEERLAYLATRDPLTQLYNRSQLRPVLEAVMKETKLGQTSAILYVDLDNFKLINDSKGHAAGDLLLVNVATLLRKTVNPEDTLIRLGGDEFVAVLSHVNEDQTCTVAQNLLKKLREFVFSDGEKNFSLAASIGIVMIHENSSADQVLAHADAACYTAKANGRNRFEVYRESQNAMSTLKEDANWLLRIHQGIKNEYFQLWFQPIIEIDSGKIMAHETLLRLKEPEREVIMPSIFWQAASRFGISNQIDRYVLKKALMQLLSTPQGDFWINLSSESFKDAETLDFIKNIFAAVDVASCRIVFELSEGEVLGNLHAVRDVMGEMKEKGFRFALDNFGSGFSAFSYLKDLPIHYLKVGGELIQGLKTQKTHRLFVKAITDVAHELNLKTVAEVIEDKTDLDLVKELKFDYAQGYFLGRPDQKIKSN